LVFVARVPGVVMPNCFSSRAFIKANPGADSAGPRH
jgi:hypothetical protein